MTIQTENSKRPNKTTASKRYWLTFVERAKKPPSPLFLGADFHRFSAAKKLGYSTLPSSSLCCKTIKDLLQWGLTWETKGHLSTMKGMRCSFPSGRHMVQIYFDNSHKIHISYYFTKPNFRESIKILYGRTSVEVTLMGHLIAVQRHTEKSLKQKRAFSSGDLKLKPWIPLDTWKYVMP